jgi:ParB family chromosome partitioning protein
MQPILVRLVGEDEYEIIAGERRWRAAQIAGLDEVPCLVREIPDEAALAMSLIENIQREDLNPLEEAGGIQRLIDEFAMTHQQAADAVGRSRPAASNLLRLLNLAKPVQELLMAGDIDMGHARALLPLDAASQIQLANLVAARQLSVRDTERLVQHTLNPRQKKAAQPLTACSVACAERVRPGTGPYPWAAGLSLRLQPALSHPLWAAAARSSPPPATACRRQ